MRNKNTKTKQQTCTQTNPPLLCLHQLATKGYCMFGGVNVMFTHKEDRKRREDEKTENLFYSLYTFIKDSLSF